MIVVTESKTAGCRGESESSRSERSRVSGRREELRNGNEVTGDTKWTLIRDSLVV